MSDIQDAPEGLLTALLAVQGEAPTLRKDATNPQGRGPEGGSHRLPVDTCPECGAPKLKRSKRCRPCAQKAQRGQRRTDNPAPSTLWARARQLRPVQQCEYDGCSALGTDRHHIDGDPANNDLSNIAVYCRRHHMTVDGRLVAAAARAPYTRKAKEAA